MSDETEDFLNVDRNIPGQNFVCLSFISPENILEDKHLYNLYKYHLSINSDDSLTFSQFKDNLENFQISNKTKIQTEFDEICDFKTNVRGVKIRGIYDTQREANVRAQVLQKMDNSFHVYVGQVGYWLPWDPNPNDIENQEYLNKDLNRLNKEYDKNQVKKDMFYEEQKRNKKQAALKENELRKKNATIKDSEVKDSEVKDSEVKDSEVKDSEVKDSEVKEEETIFHDSETVGINDKKIEDAFNEIDPWMARKLEDELEKK